MLLQFYSFFHLSQRLFFWSVLLPKLTGNFPYMSVSKDWLHSLLLFTWPSEEWVNISTFSFSESYTFRNTLMLDWLIEKLQTTYLLQKIIVYFLPRKSAHCFPLCSLSFYPPLFFTRETALLLRFTYRIDFRYSSFHFIFFVSRRNLSRIWSYWCRADVTSHTWGQR